MTISDIEQEVQGSPSWLEARRKHITSSDIACLLGCAAYAPFTPLQLFQHKMGLVHVEQSYAMAKGHAIEEPQRRYLEAKYNTLIMPKVVILDWKMTSLDGISIDGKTLFEIKLTGKTNYEAAAAGDIPRHYYSQCQWHLACVPEADTIVLHIRRDGDDATLDLPLKRDQFFIDNAEKVAYEFYTKHLLTGIPPAPQAKDYVELEGIEVEMLTRQYALVKSRLDSTEKELDLLKGRLIELAGDTNARAGGFTIARSYRQNYDYKAACKDNKIPMEKYAKPLVTSWSIRGSASSEENNNSNGGDL